MSASLVYLLIRQILQMLTQLARDGGAKDVALDPQVVQRRIGGEQRANSSFGPGAHGAHPAIGDRDVEQVRQRTQLAVAQCRPRCPASTGSPSAASSATADGPEGGEDMTPTLPG